MKQIASIIFETPDKRVLLYLRDNKDTIPFPNHWDFFGGHVEDGETPEEALLREVHEELGITLKPEDITFWKSFECLEGDAHQNVKHIWTASINTPIEEITLHEGQYPQYFTREELKDLPFANILGEIMDEYVREHP